MGIFDFQNKNIARDNKVILATGDKKLRKYAETNGVEVIRTLKIIELLFINNVISYNDFENGCKLLNIY